MKSLREKQARAIALRKEGKSYSQIKKELNVSKSSLSLWLRAYPLSNSQIYELQGGNDARIEKFRETMARKKTERRNQAFHNEQRALLPLSKKELYLAGLFLYWGEGLKVDSSEVSISNTDPQMMKFCVYWFINLLGIPKDKLTLRLHLYSDMNIDSETEFWSRSLEISRSQFRKPYIKSSQIKDVHYRSHRHGTCNLRACNIILKEKILMGIKAVADYYATRL